MGATSRNTAKARRGAAGWLKRRALASSGQDVMTKDQKVIRAKVGLLELAKQLGNVSQACKMMGYRWGIRPVPPASAVLRFRLMVKRGPFRRPQTSGEAQHETLCRVGRLRQRNLDLYR